ncbi:hypothetical protein ANN_26088 [Periplaneta americana]|uniref:BESS domain-containing protein n=1 Tax=Periplaneta americana TaxID=6978 RepID=A0ABQ8S4Y3_PERAM|nr:hypothetical protein ANN_26088 [Periplaneta americana]
MSPESSTESYPAFARIVLRENPGRNLNQVTCPDRDSNPGDLVSRTEALTVTPQISRRFFRRPAILTANTSQLLLAPFRDQLINLSPLAYVVPKRLRPISASPSKFSRAPSGEQRKPDTVVHCSLSVVEPIEVACILYQEYLCAKNMNLSNVMDVVVRTIKFIKSEGLNHMEFRALLDDINSEYGDLLYHAEEVVPFSAQVATDGTDWTVYSRTHPTADVTCWLVPFSAALTSAHWLAFYSRSRVKNAGKTVQIRGHSVRTFSKTGTVGYDDPTLEHRCQDQSDERMRQPSLAVSDCKERRKNIRGRYSKYNKKISQPSGSGVKPIKEYYLAPHLQYLKNFLKSRPSKGNTMTKQMQEKSNDDDDDNDNDEHDPLPQPLLPTTTFLSPRIVPPRKPSPPVDSDKYKKKRTRTLSDVNDTACNYFEERRKSLLNKNVTEHDPDMAFLQSVLLDIKAMNFHQKRTIKMGILQLAEQILEQNASNYSTDNGSLSREVIAPSRCDVISLESVNATPTYATLSTSSANSTTSVTFITSQDVFRERNDGYALHLWSSRWEYGSKSDQIRNTPGHLHRLARTKLILLIPDDDDDDDDDDDGIFSEFNLDFNYSTAFTRVKLDNFSGA